MKVIRSLYVTYPESRHSIFLPKGSEILKIEQESYEFRVLYIWNMRESEYEERKLLIKRQEELITEDDIKWVGPVEYLGNFVDSKENNHYVFLGVQEA